MGESNTEFNGQIYWYKWDNWQDQLSHCTFIDEQHKSRFADRCIYCDEGRCWIAGTKNKEGR